MIPLPSVLICPRRVRRARSFWPGFGLVFAPMALWLILALALRAFGS